MTQENKINIAELLKDCPSGMELDCTIVDGLYFDKVTENNTIKCYSKRFYESTSTCNSICFYSDGSYLNHTKAKCVIFPKGKTTWEGFVPPYQFEDGDILYVDCNDDENTDKQYKYIFILKKIIEGKIYCYCYISKANIHKCFEICLLTSIKYNPRLATEEEKEILFDAIKANGYKWNEETKTMEKLVEPKFKVGDKVLWNYDTKIIKTISKVQLTKSRGYVYWIDGKGCSSGWWNENELTPIPNKFDITTLKPFDKVLVRLTKDGVWNATFFSHYDKEVKWGCYPFITTGSKSYPMCIPYNEDTKYLLGTTNDCDEFYKTW